MSLDSGTPTALELLILSASLDETERFITSLRNGGLAVHGHRVHEMDTLEDTLLGSAWDMILCCEYDAHIDLDRVMQVHGELDKDIPLLVLYGDDAEPSRLLEAMSRGARDLVKKDDPTLLQLVVAREFGDLQTRRELKVLRRRLEETEQRCTSLIDSSQEPIAFFQDGMHVHVNAAYLALFGYEVRSDVEDLPLLDMVDKPNHRALRAALKQLESEPERKVTLEVTCRRSDGNPFEATLSLSRATMEGEPSVQVMVRSAAETARVVEERIQQPTTLAIDTDLPNRQHFMGKLSEWLAARGESPDVPALMFISLDNLRRLLDAGGAERCDATVKAIGKVLRDMIGADEMLARFGDNTFTILCHRSPAERIGELAEAVRARIQAHPLEGIDEPLTCSLGIALLTDTEDDPEDAINRAYSACEAARAEGGNRVSVYDSSPPPSAAPQPSPQEARILDLIARGLSENRFRLLYQPIVSLQGDTRENYSVLVRLMDVDDGELLPEFFLKQAEQWGRMGNIDRWIIRNAIATLSRQRREGRKVNFFITLSEASLTDRNLLLWICDCLREYQARGGWLTFQIREQLAQTHLADAARLIDGLKKIKCQIALDHFGLQAEPQTLLEKLPIDYIKLAPDFARELASNPKKQEALSALNELAQSHGLKAIATAVEDANSLTVLWTVGVSYIQGYFLQEPSETIEYAAAQLA